MYWYITQKVFGGIMKNYGRLVKDVEQFEYFVNEVLPPLKEGEVYFLSLSARNKYLNEEEREQYKLSRTEMFSRTLCYGDWEYAMKKMASTLTYKTTKSGLPFPEKALVVYVNINPSNVPLAAMKFSASVNKIAEEMVRSYMVGSGNPNLKSLDKAERMLLNEIQKTTGTRHYFDIDVDSKEKQDVEVLTAVLDAYDVKYHQVNTVGGAHIFVNRESLKQSKLKNLHEQVKKVNDKLKTLGGECVFNSNAMSPLVGTFQAGALVTLEGFHHE